VLVVFIIFFFFVYVICEFFKFNRFKKEYNQKVVYVKLVSICLTVILTFIHRFTKDGVLDRSNSIKTTVIYYGVFFILIAISVIDIKKAKVK
jgi:hypothetical protein